jgi:hypothetical protein
MRVELKNIEEIKPYENNPRRNEHAVQAIARSIAEFGFRQPLVIDDAGMIIVGDGRYKAALLLGLKEVPVHVAKGLTQAQIKAYRIADNKTAELADWDYDLLVKELADLQELDFDVDLLGFSAADLQELLDGEVTQGLADPDEVPEPPDKAITRTGDLWLLGPHRVLCGDSGKAKDVDRLLGGEVVHLVNTDPPYNVKLEPRSNNAIAAGLTTHHPNRGVARRPAKAKVAPRKLRARDRPLENDFVSGAQFQQLLGAWFGNIARVLQPGRAFYLWGGYSNLGNYPAALEACGLYFSQQIIWVKEHPVLTQGFSRQSRVVFLWLAPGSGSPVFRSGQRERRLVSQESQSTEHGPFDGEAGGAGCASHAVFIAGRGKRSRPFWRQRFDLNCRGADRQASVPSGTRCSVLRCNCAALGEFHG